MAETKKSKRELALEAAAEDFVRKVDTGFAKSTDSYRKFKAALAVKDETID